MALNEQRKKQLDEIVLNLAGQNAPQADVQAVVNDFKGKYENEGGLLEKASDLEKEVRSSISEEFGGVISDTKSFIKEGVQSIKETIQASPEERKQTLADAGKTILEMPKNFAKGLYDIARIQAPIAGSTLATAVLDNTRIRIGLGLPGIDFLNIGGDFADKLSYEPEILKEARQKASQWTDDITSILDQKQQDRIRDLGITPDTSIFDPRNFGYKLASGAGSMALAFGLATITKNPTLAVGALGLLEGSQSYNDARVKLKEQNPEMKKEDIDRQALNSATVNTVGIALLERVGLDFLFRTYGGGVLRKMAINSITETVQETSQTVWSNLVARLGYDKSQNVLEGVLDTIILTMPIGFFGGGVIGGEADTQLLTEGLPDDVVKKVASSTGLSEDEAKELIKEVVPAIDEEVNKTVTKIQADESKDIVAQELASGKSPNQVALELSDKLGTEEALKLVNEVVSGKTEEIVETSPETKPKTALEDTQKELADITDKIDDTVLDKTPVDIQTDFDNAQNKFEQDITQIKKDIADIKERVNTAPKGSAEKAKAKEALVKAQQSLKKAEADFNTKITNQAGSFREFLGDYIKSKLNLDLSGKEQSDLIDNIVIQITEPEIVIKNMGASLRNIITREVQRLTPKTTKLKGLAEMTTDEAENERIRLINKRLTGQLTEEEDALLEEIISKIKTQKKPAKEKKKKDVEKKAQENPLHEIKEGSVEFLGSNANGFTEEEAKSFIEEAKTKYPNTSFTTKKHGKDSLIIIGTANVDKTLKVKQTKDNEPDKDIGGKSDEGGVPETLPVGTKEPRGTGGETVVKQRGGRTDRDTDGDVGNRPSGTRIESIKLEKGKKYTNEEIEKLVNELTIIENGNVKLTNKELINDDVLEAINQYEVGGTLKEGRGILDEYFTNSKIVDVVSQILNVNKNVKVLEPSVGSGNFVYAIPQNYRTLDALEINPITAGISKILHNDINVRTDPFESLFVDERGNSKEFKADYDLVIGNPPYGTHRGFYKGLGEENKISRYEVYFIKRSLDLVKEGGTVAMVVPSGFLRGASDYGKTVISKNAVLQEAWRLPNGSFESTDIGTDILIFKKETNTKENTLDLISGDKYFSNNPNNILGIQAERKGKFGLEPYVSGSLDEAVNMFSDRRTEMLSKKLLTDNDIEITDESISDTENTVEDQTDKIDPKVTAEKIKEDIKKKKVVSKIKKDTEVVIDKNRQITTISELVSDLSSEEIDIWKRTNTEGWVENPTEAEKETLNFYNDNYYNDFNYAQGDIYEKLDTLESEKSKIKESKYGEQKSKLLAVLPKVETTGTIKLPPNHPFIEKVKLSNGNSLRSNFLSWLNDLPSDVFGSSSNHEIREYVNKEQVRGRDKKYNERIRERRKTKAEELFKKYLVQLEGTDKTLVEKEYNQQYNSYYKPKFDKVPLFSKIHATFKGKKFGLRNAQKEALGMIATRGNAIVGLETGNGKTIVGILATTEAMHREQTKRPIWVVPNPSIGAQWVKTAKDLIPNIKINNLGNLGGDLKDVSLSDLEIKEGEITVVTQKGLTALSFTDETYKEMSEKFKYISDELSDHKSKRQKEKDKTDTEGIAGAMKRKTRGDITFEKLGFDFMVFDEVQMANHIISKVKMEKGEATDFRASEVSSDLGMKTWLASQYIQARNNGRGFIGLSATPFTNNPLEYYSVISLVGQKYLNKIGATNVNDFFNMFMEASTEYEVRPNGTIEKKNDIRGFKNNRQWKNLLNQFAVFAHQPKDIIVPDKFNKSYYVPQNEMQIEFNLKAQDLFNDPVAGSLLGVGEMKKIAFSPFLSRYYDGVLTKADYKKFVDGSPKIKATMELIKQNKKDKPEAGQIIYTAAIGKDTSPLMQEYLIKELGFKTDEVGIINGDTPPNKRIELQERYNNGEVKVIIGSDAIQVGVELQINSTDLYIIGMPWNFTALKQVAGRIHRQNNKWKNVRINIMMSENSADVFQMQKIQNKQDRYEASILNDAQEIDLGDIDSEEMKADLMTDPEKKAKFIIQQKTEILNDKIETAKSEQAFALRKFEKITDLQNRLNSAEKSLANEKQLGKDTINKGEQFDDFWVVRYTKQVQDLEKEIKVEMDKLAEKGIDVEKLKEIQERTTEEIKKLETEKTSNKEGEAELIKRIASEMPVLKIFSDNDLKLFVSEREKENKTFYELRSSSVDEVIKVEENVKEIKNASKTKVLKTVKKVEVVKEDRKVTPEKKSGTKNLAMLKILTDPKLSIQQKVDTLLDKRQEGKEYKDVGDRVAGSKKENAVIQAVIENGDSEVLRKLAEELGNDTILAQLDKKKILEDIQIPTVELEKSKGTPAWIANYKINVYNKINNVPRTIDSRGRYSSRIVNERVMEDFIVNYPSALINFVTNLSNIATYEDVNRFMNTYRFAFLTVREKVTPEMVERLENRRRRVIDPTNYLYETDEQIRSEELNKIADEMKNGATEIINANVLGVNFATTVMDLNNVRQDGSFLSGRYGISARLKYDNAQKVLASSAGIYSYFDDYYKKNRYTVIPLVWGEDYGQSYGGSTFYDNYEEAVLEFKTVLKKNNIKEADVLENTKKQAAETIKDLETNYDKFLPKTEVGIPRQIKNTQAEIKRLVDDIARIEKDTGKEKSDWEIRSLERLKKELETKQEFLARLTGEEKTIKHGNFEEIKDYDVKDTRFSKDFLKAENLIKVYGFRSAQLGNYMDDVSAKEHITQTMASVEDMGKILNLDIAKITHDMGLSIAFGARGGGGSAVAHFEPAHKIINITKRRGDGSFGHEFLHALDSILGSNTIRGKWSGGGDRYGYASGDRESILLTKALVNGVKIEVEEKYVPKQDINERYADLILEFKNGTEERKPMSMEETIDEISRRSKLAHYDDNHISSYQIDIYNQAIADVYRKEFTGKVIKNSNEFYKGSNEFGGGKASYWTRKEELWARAFQAYLEDKLNANGIKNNYLTRSTIGIKVYPQGAERVEYNKLFDKLFDAIRDKYPLPEKLDDIRFKTTGEVSEKYTKTEAENYLNDLKRRLNIDFDTVFVNSILVPKTSNSYSRKVFGDVVVYGATSGNMIALVNDMASYTAEHETVHLTLRNMDRISIFKRNGLSMEKVLNAQADKMGKKLTSENAVEIEEQLALNFESYVVKKQKTVGILNRFFRLLNNLLIQFATVVGITKGDVIDNYFSVLLEGRNIDGEIVRLENKGTMEAFIEDGILELDTVPLDGADFRFKVGEEKNEGLKKAKQTFNDLSDKNDALEEEVTKEGEDLLKKDATEIEISDFLNVKTRILENKEQLSKLRRYISKTTDKNISTNLKDVERRLLLREFFLKRTEQELVKPKAVKVAKVKPIQVDRKGIPEVIVKEVPEKDNKNVSKFQNRMLGLLAEQNRDDLYYDRMSKLEEIAKAEEYYNKNKKRTINIALGEEAVPSDVSHNVIALTVIQKAKENGDMATIAKVLPKLSLRATRQGQEISMLRDAFGDKDPISYMNKLIKERKLLAEKKYKPLFAPLKTAQKLDEIVKRKVVKARKTGSSLRETLTVRAAEIDSFLNDIMC